MTRAESPAPYVGIDVSKDALDVAMGEDTEIWTVPNTAQGVAACVRRLLAVEPTLIVLESTGAWSGACWKSCAPPSCQWRW